MNFPLVSIIVPIYKAEQWLHRCVDSILVQTMTDFELLLIDDGSPDKSGEICDEYATKDSRIRVFHKENGGVSSARNLGLDNAKGKWITFVDSDDSVGVKFLEKFFIKDNGEIDLVVSGLKRIQKGVETSCISLKDSEFTLPLGLKTLFDDLNILEYGFTGGKLFRTNIVKENKIYFDERISYSEDLLFVLNYLLHIEGVRFLSSCDYEYQLESSVLSTRYNSFESEHKLFIELFKLIKSFEGNFKFELSSRTYSYVALTLMRSVYSIYNNREKYTIKERISILKTVKKSYKEFLSSYYLPQIALFKLAKKLYFANVYLFDLFCLLKF